MAWTGDPIWLADALRAEGCTVHEMPGWLERGHGDFGSIWGSMVHHTGANNTGKEFIRDGRIDLAGPIANVHVDRAGTMNLVAVGIAYHAGSGYIRGVPKNAGNWHIIGFEVQYDGKAWTPAQWEEMVKACAAVSRKLGKNAANSVVGHKEYSDQGKWDPGAWDMAKFRMAVDAQLRGWRTPPQGTPLGWTLQPGEYYGPLSGPDISISGLYGELSSKMGSLRAFQEAAGIPVTGHYDTATAHAARTVQKRHNIKGWGQVNLETWTALMTEKETMATTLDTTFKSDVPGSTFEAPLASYIVKADRYGYQNQQILKRIETKLDRVEAKQDALADFLEKQEA